MVASDPPATPRRHRVGILLSGRGSNFEALHAAMVAGTVPAEIGLVVSNVAEAPGLARARDLGLETVCHPHRESPNRTAHDEKVVSDLRAAGGRMGLPCRLHASALAGLRCCLWRTYLEYPSQPATGLPGARGAPASDRAWCSGFGMYRPSGRRRTRQRPDRGPALGAGVGPRHGGNARCAYPRGRAPGVSSRPSAAAYRGLDGGRAAGRLRYGTRPGIAWEAAPGDDLKFSWSKG